MIPMTPALPLVAARRKGPLDHLLYGSRPLAGGGMSSTSAADFLFHIHGYKLIYPLIYLMKLVIIGFSLTGSGMPALRPASMHLRSHAMLRPSSRITCIPSSS